MWDEKCLLHQSIKKRAGLNSYTNGINHQVVLKIYHSYTDLGQYQMRLRIEIYFCFSINFLSRFPKMDVWLLLDESEKSAWEISGTVTELPVYSSHTDPSVEHLVHFHLYIHCHPEGGEINSI